MTERSTRYPTNDRELSTGMKLTEALDETSNVLLLTAPHDGHEHDDEACTTFVSQHPTDETNALGITYSQNAYERLGLWERHESEYPANTTVVDVGAQTRSAASDGTGTIAFPPDPYKIRTVADKTDLTGLGKVVTEELSDWEHSENVTVACFYSVTDLLEHVSKETAFKFLHVLSTRMQSESVTTHYHMDPDAHDEKTIRMFSELFDTIVEVSENGVWEITTQ